MSRPATDFLAGVVAEQRARVAGRRHLRRELEARAAAAPERRELAAAIRRRGAAGALAVVAEVKRRSPSAGGLAAIADAGGLALRYALGGATAISVLTEERHFSGELRDLARVRDVVRVPVLRKDFVVDELQLLEARAYGADAVLLIAEALDAASLRALLDAAAGLGLEALVEAHEEAALDRAIASGAALVGINQRDLRTLALERDTVARLAARVPEGRVLVAESGIASADDVRALPPRVDAILVGEALVRAADPAALLRELAGARAAEAT